MRILILLLFSVISGCTTYREIKCDRNVAFIVKDTISLKGIIIQNTRKHTMKFFVLKDSLLKQDNFKFLINKKSDYNFIEPYKFRRHYKGLSVCNDTLKQVTYTKNILKLDRYNNALYIQEDDFLIIEDSCSNRFLTLKCW